MTTDVGPVELEVPRDREESVDPQIVRKRQRRLTGVDAMVLSTVHTRTHARGDLRAPGRSDHAGGLSAIYITTRRDGLPLHALNGKRIQLLLLIGVQAVRVAPNPSSGLSAG